MPDYQTLYLTLFNTLTDAIEQIDNNNYGTARSILVKAQQDAEEQYISESETL